jgi:hypothetical protein
MKTLKKIIFLLIFGSLTTITFAQNSSIEFDYKGVSYEFLTFEQIGCTVNSDNISILIREKPLPPREALSGAIKWKKGKRILINIHQSVVRLPIMSIDSLHIDHTDFQEGERQNVFTKDKTKTNQKLADKKTRLRNSVRDREIQLEKLNKRIEKGDMTAMAELENLTEATNNRVNQIEEGEETNSFENVDYFSLKLYLPIEDGQKEQEITMLTGRISIETLTPKYMILRFEGDTETNSSKKTDKNLLKEGGFTRGKIKVYFNKYQDERGK